MAINDLGERGIASLLGEMAKMSASIAYWLSVGETGERKAEIASELELQADEITDSIKALISLSKDQEVLDLGISACDKVWEAAALAIAVISSEDEDEYSDDE